MTTRTDLFSWEQDGSGGLHGMATFTFPLAAQEICIRIETFREAFELLQAINTDRRAARQDARAELLAEIARIEP